MKPKYLEVVEALEGMANQYLMDIDGNVMTHDFMVAGERCLDVLYRAGIVKTKDRIHYYMIDKKEGINA